MTLETRNRVRENHGSVGVTSDYLWVLSHLVVALRINRFEFMKLIRTASIRCQMPFHTYGADIEGDKLTFSSYDWEIRWVNMTPTRPTSSARADID